MPNVPGGPAFRVIGLVFAEQRGTDAMRWLCGVVLDSDDDDDDGDWVYAELKRDRWIACPGDAVPESALAQLHMMLSASRN